MSDDGGAAPVAWVGTGSNVGARDRALTALREAVAEDGVVTVAQASPVILTRPVGVIHQPDFHNQVLRLEAGVPLPAREWLRRCQAAEGAAGRRHTYAWGPRRADADVLLLGSHGEVRYADGRLRVPHPELGNRPFWHALLASLDPDLRHPDGWRFAAHAAPWEELVPQSRL